MPYTLFLRRNTRRYVVMTLLFGGSMALSAAAEAWPLFCLLLGFYLGCLLRDYGWVASMRKSWPFTERVTDWAEVRRLAEA